MPKIRMKTKKAVLSRFKITAKGKLKASHAGRKHFLTRKSANKKRHLSKRDVFAVPQEKKYKKLVGA